MPFLLVLPLALILAWSQRGGGPSRQELAQALAREVGRPVDVGDLRSITCSRASGPLGALCQWQQRQDGVWRERSGRLLAHADGWRLERDVVPPP
jgi:hypothetical protein